LHRDTTAPWEHDHVFGQDEVKPAERRTLIVIALTAVTMVVEIAAGITYGSMALLADGLHMGSHAMALGLAAAAYVYARRHASDPRYAFGTGKVNALGGFAGAILLVIFALMMVVESLDRLVHPVPIVFDQALLVAVVGLAVNAVSMGILGGGHTHDEGRGHVSSHHDHNLRSAYLHVTADALTSFLAIGALLAGKYLGARWVDPMMGVVGAALVARWSWGLLCSSSRVLLDHQAPVAVRDAVVSALESDGDTRVVDLHVWSVAPGLNAADIVLVASNARKPDDYRELLPDSARIVHATVEVQRCLTGPA